MNVHSHRDRLAHRLCLVALVLATGCAGAKGTRVEVTGGSSVASPGSTAPSLPAASDEGWSLDGSIGYQIFVRSFHDTNGDGKGDLAGVLAKLDYLNDGDPGTDDDLGVDLLVLLPIFPALAYHGFDPLDFTSVHPELGTLEDFDALVTAAEARGMRILLELPINATSVGHRWFRGAWRDSSMHHDWYRFRRSDPGWKHPAEPARGVWHAIDDTTYYHALRSPAQPDLALENPAVREALVDAMAFWVDRGVAGFRVDVARYLVETERAQVDAAESLTFLEQLNADLRRRAPDAVLLGDAAGEIHDLLPYLGRSGGAAPRCDAVTTRALSERILRGVREGTSSALATVLRALDGAPEGAGRLTALSHHDEPRTARALALQPDRIANAAAILFTLPGVPVLHYGEELGTTDGDAPVGLAARLPMAWHGKAPGYGFADSTSWAPFPPGAETANVEAQRQRGDSLLAQYLTWMQTRRAEPALARGSFALLSAPSGRAPVLCFLREWDGGRLLVAHNVTDRSAGIDVDLDAASLSRVLAAPTVSDPAATDGRWRITLPPRESGIWRLR